MDFPIRFLPEDRTYLAHQPIELMLAAASCDIWVEQPCGSKAICGKCCVRVREGNAALSPADERLLTREDLNQGWRLACQLVLSGPAVIEIPEVTRSVAAKPFGDASLFAGGFRPNLSKHYLELEPPAQENQYADLDLIGRALSLRDWQGRRLTASLALARRTSRILRENGYRITAIVEGNELVALEPGDSSARCFGVAVDIGSTTLAAALLDLRTGTVLNAVSRLNPQVRYGGDIISRIHFAQEHERGNEELHDALLLALRQMLSELAEMSGIAPAHIYAMVCAGNPTMTHSAVGADITPLGQAPYVGLWTREWTVHASELELPVNEGARVRFMPMIRSHVGGDTVAAVLASGMDRDRGWRLLIDLGTNSEVVVGSRERMVATSTAAGPAFEGANIHHGMRAAPGAIDAVRISPDGRVVSKTVGNQPARGLCGSGLIDAAAELSRAGVITPSGYMPPREQLAGLPDSLLQRCVKLPDGQNAFALDGDVVLTAQDVRQLQLIKASIYAGVEILMRNLAITADDLEEVQIAGAFGNFVRKSSAQAIGLVPNIDPEKIKFIGNAAGVGARMALVDARARRRAIRIAQRCEYVELAGHPEYQDLFANAIPFPVGA